MFSPFLLLNDPALTFWAGIQFLMFWLLIVGSFLVSSAEVAYFSLTKAEIDEFRQDNSRIGQRVWDLVNYPKRLLATILITNNFVNVAAILVASTFLRSLTAFFTWGPSVQLLLEILLITSLLLFFGEIIPKVYATRNRLRLVRFLSWPLESLRFLLYPLSQALIFSTRFIDRRVQLKEITASLDDLRHAIDLTHKREEDETEEKSEKETEILKGIVNFSNISVRSIMQARVNVKAIELEIGFEELIEFIKENNFSRLPVYSENLDNIQGVLHIKDLLPFLQKGSVPLDLNTLLREVYFVPESKKIDDLLEEFKTQHLHLAVVVDEFGGTTGIVTLEDIIEEIFGEINDEFDSDDWVYTKLDDSTYVFEGRISLNDVKKIMSLEDSVFEDARGDSDSLGGLILELNGKFPEKGEIIPYRYNEIYYALHVESVGRKRISMVKLVVAPENVDADS